MTYKDPAKKREWDRQRRARNTLQIQELKNNPCTDCGQMYAHYCMEWDHVEGHLKVATIGKLACKGLNSKKLVDELAKVELVCCVCHRIRTWERRIKS